MSGKIIPLNGQLNGPDLKSIGDQSGFKTLLTFHLQRAEVSLFIPAVRTGNYQLICRRTLIRPAA